MRRQGAADHRAAADHRPHPVRSRGPSRRRDAARARRGGRSEDLDRHGLPHRPPVRGSRHPRPPRIRRRPLALRSGVGRASRPSDRRRDRQGHRVRRRGARGAAEADRREARLPPRRPPHGAVRRRPRPRPLDRRARRPARAAPRIAGAGRCWLLALPAAASAVEGAAPAARRWPRRFLGGCGWIVGARRPHRSASRSAPHTPAHLPTTSAGSTSSCSPARPAAPSCPRTSSATPLIHWLADQNHTLYVRRDDRRGAPRPGRGDRRRARAARSRWRCSPKARPAPGDQLLPFRSTLLAAVAPPPPGVDGPPGRDRLWRRRDRDRLARARRGKDNVLRMLGRPGTLPVTVRLLDPLDRAADRKAMAAARARRDRRARSRFKSPPGSPIGRRDDSHPQDLPHQILRLPDERL